MEEHLTIGFDISTSVTGIAVLRSDGSLLELDYVDTRKIDNLWNVADTIRHRISKLNLQRSYDNLFIEENMQRYRQGASSASTIVKLAKINGIVSYMARTAFRVEPEFIQANAARRALGIKLVKPRTKPEKKDPLWTKKQVFEHLNKSVPDIQAVSWPMTRPSKVNPNGRMRDECFDMLDAYVVARAGLMKKN